MKPLIVTPDALAVIHDRGQCVYACMAMAETVAMSPEAFKHDIGSGMWRIIAGFMGVVAELVHQQFEDDDSPLWEQMGMDGYDTDYIPWVLDFFLDPMGGFEYVESINGAFTGESMEEKISGACTDLRRAVILYLEELPHAEDDGQPTEHQEWLDFDGDC